MVLECVSAGSAPRFDSGPPGAGTRSNPSRPEGGQIPDCRVPLQINSVEDPLETSV